ncbi:Pre-rRNA-processing protein esf-2 [Tetrabaena socialis]|uniref:Pre-rRNA-processing protein esf-2 n=1 Tax=Tetrabaena socialis TaxID=47790 RepID=A0A2J7ZMB3_9CHLO|nr:Pre-rRNA-processing protein esf-2 [Tetrabaena socialis]|eukprot:PNH01390.1 Pre-rRNA-processing protein esf-2 [Tetrabaena socialis]
MIWCKQAKAATTHHCHVGSHGYSPVAWNAKGSDSTPAPTVELAMTKTELRAEEPPLSSGSSTPTRTGGSGGTYSLMSAANKKRKLGHGSAPAAPVDPRFQVDSDFSDGDASDGAEDGAPEPRAGSAVAAAAAGKSRRGAGAAAAAAPKRAAAPSHVTPEDDDTGALEERGEGEGVSDGEGEGVSDGEGGASDGGGDGGAAAEGAQAAAEDEPRRRRKKVLSRKRLEAVNEASDKRGIIFVSRIPPHMKPHKLRQLLEPYGTLGRVYCSPEDPALRRLRKQKGGNSGKNFTEGWVEFEDKRRAKRAAVCLEVPAWCGFLPVDSIESVGSGVMQNVLNAMVPRFLAQLRTDYQLWASGDESRKPVGEL